MSYNCPSREERDGYHKFSRLRESLDEHARDCDSCRERLLIPRRRLARARMMTAARLAGLLLLFSGVAFQGAAWMAPATGCEVPLASAPSAPTPPVAAVAARAIQLNGHTFQGSEASKIDSAFEGSDLYTIRPGDTLSRVAERKYGQASAGLWQAIVEFNNHPQNPRSFEKRYGMELREQELLAGQIIQLPPKPVLLLIVNRVEVANVPSGL